MSIDFSSMTPKALQKLIAEATREQKRKKKRAPVAQVRAKLTRQAKAEGYTIQELFGVSAAAPAGETPRRTRTKLGKAAKSSTGRKVPPKYRNPENSDQTWTGRGKAPLWFVAATEAGKSREDLLIP